MAFETFKSKNDGYKHDGETYSYSTANSLTQVNRSIRAEDGESFEIIKTTNHPSHQALINYFKNLFLDDLSSVQRFQYDCWIAGGAIREFFLNGYVSQQSDIDVYFRNEAAYNIAKAWFTDPNMNMPPIENAQNADTMRKFLNRPIGIIDYENENALRINYKNQKIDLVKRFTAGPERTIMGFDMSVAMAAVDCENFYSDISYFPDLIERKIVIKSLHHPLSTMQRVFKYIDKGFKINRYEILKLAKAIKTVPINEINPIEFALDQLENPNGVKKVNYADKKDPLYGTNGDISTTGKSSTIKLYGVLTPQF